MCILLNIIVKMEGVPESHPEHPRQLIPQLCKEFHRLGWCTGMSGGISIKVGKLIYLPPTGVLKERLTPDDLFVFDEQGSLVEGPRGATAKLLRPSQRHPIFFNAFKLRKVNACIHAHSMHAVVASMLFEKEFRISHVEMLEGIRHGVTGEKRWFADTLIVPIINNTDEEGDLCLAVAKTMTKYPDTSCVIVRRHGFYVWGENWKITKAMAECYDYLFELSAKMRTHRL